MTEVKIEALKPFNRTAQGDLCEVGDVFAVTKSRSEELERLGLAKPASADKAKPEVKAAPVPENKAKPAPANKRKA